MSSVSPSNSASNASYRGKDRAVVEPPQAPPAGVGEMVYTAYYEAMGRYYECLCLQAGSQVSSGLEQESGVTTGTSRSARRRKAAKKRAAEEKVKRAEDVGELRNSDGACYLYLVRDDAAARVYSEEGLWPTAKSLMSRSADDFKSAEALQGYGVSFDGSVLHMSFKVDAWAVSDVFAHMATKWRSVVGTFGALWAPKHVLGLEGLVPSVKIGGEDVERSFGQVKAAVGRADEVVRARISAMVLRGEFGRVVYVMGELLAPGLPRRTHEVVSQQGGAFRVGVDPVGLVAVPPDKTLRVGKSLWSPISSWTALVVRGSVEVSLLEGCQSLGVLALDKKRWLQLCGVPGFLGKSNNACRMAYLEDAPSVTVVSKGWLPPSFPEKSAGLGLVDDDDDYGVEVEGMRGAVLSGDAGTLTTLPAFGPVYVEVLEGTVVVGSRVLTVGEKGVFQFEGGKAEIVFFQAARCAVRVVVDEYVFDGGGPSAGESEVSGSEYVASGDFDW